MLSSLADEVHALLFDQTANEGEDRDGVVDVLVAEVLLLELAFGRVMVGSGLIAQSFQSRRNWNAVGEGERLPSVTAQLAFGWFRKSGASGDTT